MKVARQQYRKVKLSEVEPHPRNPRKGSLEAITESLEANDFYGAIVVQKATGYVLAGNHRLLAAKKAGAKELPAMVVDCDDETALRILLADNATSDKAEYDTPELHALLKEIGQEAGTLEGTGWGFDDFRALEREVAALTQAEVEEPEIIPEPPSDPRSRPGEVYELGPHRLMCGDCRSADDVATLLEGQKINLAFTSPPYADRRRYDDASRFRPVPPDEYVEWFEPVQVNVAAHLAADGSWFVNIKPSADGLDTELYVFDLVLAHARRWGWHFATEFCWERNGVPKNVTRRFKNQFEPIYQFTRGEWKMRADDVRHFSEHVPRAAGPGVGNTGWADAQGGNGPMFGAAKRRKHGVRGQAGEDVQGTNWQPGEAIGPGLAYPGNRLPTFTQSHEATGHTAAFPVGLPEFFIRAYTDDGDTVYDPFMGSGSTLLAAEKSGRASFGMEISPAYCDVIRDRYEAFATREQAA